MLNAVTDFPTDMECKVMKYDFQPMEERTWEVIIEGPLNRLTAAERIFKELVDSEIQKLVNEQYTKS